MFFLCIVLKCCVVFFILNANGTEERCSLWKFRNFWVAYDRGCVFYCLNTYTMVTVIVSLLYLNISSGLSALLVVCEQLNKMRLSGGSLLNLIQTLRCSRNRVVEGFCALWI